MPGQIYPGQAYPGQWVSDEGTPPPITGTSAVIAAISVVVTTALLIFSGPSAAASKPSESAATALEIFSGTSAVAAQPSQSSVTALEQFVASAAGTAKPSTGEATALEEFVASAVGTAQPSTGTAEAKEEFIASSDAQAAPSTGSGQGTVTVVSGVAPRFGIDHAFVSDYDAKKKKLKKERQRLALIPSVTGVSHVIGQPSMTQAHGFTYRSKRQKANDQVLLLVMAAHGESEWQK